MTMVILFKAFNEDSKVDSYENCFSGMGFSVKVISPIDFVFCNEDVLIECVNNSDKYDGLILSSPRCVNAVADAFKYNIGTLEKWCCLPTFVVGETTDKLANDLGLTTEGKYCGNAALLGELIASRTIKKPLLYPIGSLTSDHLKKKLEKEGIQLDTHVVYKTVIHPKLETAVENILSILPAYLAFFSPSGVMAVLPILSRLGVNLDEQKIFAIGPTTEKALKDHGIKIDGTAEKPTPESLLAAIMIFEHR